MRFIKMWGHLIRLKIIGTCERISGKGIIPKKYFIPFLPENPVILEAGAHKGKDTVELSKTWPKGSIYAFEPVPDLYEKLVKRTKNLGNVFCCPFALGDTSGLDLLHVSSGSSDGSSSLLPPKEHLITFPTVYFDESLHVRVITLDDWARDHNVEAIDFMWLDLQGMELKVLKSGTSILKSVKAIYTEVSTNEDYEGQNKYPELRLWLEERGFRVDREELNPGGGNVFFIRMK